MLGSGLGPLPEIIPGARVGTGYVGLGETPGARVGWTNGAGVGTLGHSGTSQHASLGSTTILQPSGRLLKEGHLNKKNIISKISYLKIIQFLYVNLYLNLKKPLLMPILCFTDFFYFLFNFWVACAFKTIFLMIFFTSLMQKQKEWHIWQKAKNIFFLFYMIEIDAYGDC